MQPPGSMAREAQPGVQRSHSQSACANAAGEPGSESADGGRLALQACATFNERSENAGSFWAKHLPAPSFTDLFATESQGHPSFRKSRQVEKENQSWQPEQWNNPKSRRRRHGLRRAKSC